MSNIVEGAFVIFIILCSSFGSYVNGWSRATDAIRVEAVEAGVAEFVDDKTGESTFRWKRELVEPSRLKAR